MAILLNTRRLLESFGANSVKQMSKNAAPYSASGETAKSFRYDVSNFGLMLLGAENLRWAEQGRGPTTSSKKGNPPLREIILKWITTKGLPLWRDKKGRFIPRETQAFLITRKIHQSGVSFFRNKQARDIYSSVITEAAVLKLIERIEGDYIVSAKSDIVQSIKLMFDVRKQAAA